ncbi:sugar transferase [Aphanothece sacrum]|uniref:Glucosyl transferase n=1 Tax=Aphanothece sacrum FPU1 TaxID=1920663 RepID=A0A401ICC9_APHSA|nr:sugar transferase [Aphanothece sacrum]GBF78876.1 glucosyl transferase [Aphanothece sacrum FPU1]GBF83106.1 glucosyl transferase [Aphanothece sacrum FPU3]
MTAYNYLLEDSYKRRLTQYQYLLRSLHPSIKSKVKRLVDIVGGLFGLGITMIIAIPIAISMAISDPGPLLYSQVRCGLHGRPFRIWKFRSMVVGADKMKHLVKNEASGHIFKNTNDPRITCLGAFLRRTSIDEFPQFWNVLVGDMSLVGTRPPTVDEVEKYDPHHWERLKVKPGITGEWQVNGRSTVKDFEDIVKMDIDYQRKWSLGYDLSLIFKTIQVVFNKSGAC